MDKATPRGLLKGLLAGLTLWYLSASFLLPVTQDEAYYFDWARHLYWGYFDHPPGVALLGLGVQWFPSSAFAARLGNLLAALGLLWAALRFYRACGLPSKALFLALVLVGTSFPGLAVGVLATPDTPLALCWMLALHESLIALRGARRRWLSAGLFTGLGLLSKYTMVLIGPVFLWAMLRADRKALKTPWPYLGFCLAMLVFLPNLVWNAQHDWISIRFQLGHGFSTTVGDAFRTPATQAPRDLIQDFSSLMGYLGMQLGLWGGIGLIGLWFLPRLPRGMQTLDPPARILLIAGSLFPLGFFGLISLFSAVEANWPVPYLLSAAPLLALALRDQGRWVLGGAALNLLIAGLLVYQGATAKLPLPDSQNRILRETHGFADLAREAAQLSGPIFSDRYQTIAQLRFYQPDLRINQWPRWTRPSEYLRGTLSPPITREEIQRAGGFWLLLSQPLTPVLAGYTSRNVRDLLDCPSKPLSDRARCEQPLHRWRIIRYVPTE